MKLPDQRSEHSASFFVNKFLGNKYLKSKGLQKCCRISSITPTISASLTGFQILDNGCAERFIRTLKENLLWIRTFETVEELRLAVLDFQKTYNENWIIQRLKYQTPSQARRNACNNPKKVA